MSITTKILTVLLFSASFNIFAENTKVMIHTPNAPAPIGTYSQAIRWGDTVYISGQIPIDPKTNLLVNDSFSAQTRQVFMNLSAIATAAGGELNDILKLTIYLTDLHHFTEVNQIMSEYFHEPYPARAVIEIKDLPKDAPIEIEATMGITP